MADKMPYIVLAPPSVAWWFAMALYADRAGNDLLRELALKTTAEIAAEKKASHD